MTNVQFIQKKIMQFESFVNDVLREDLKKLEAKMDEKNAEISEFLQLKSTIDMLKATNCDKNGFKTKLDIGNNFYVQARVDDATTILLDVGLGHFVEFSLDEALVVIDVRVRLLKRQIENFRRETAKTKAHIKLIIMSLQELQGLE